MHKGSKPQDYYFDSKYNNAPMSQSLPEKLENLKHSVLEKTIYRRCTLDY